MGGVKKPSQTNRNVQTRLMVFPTQIWLAKGSKLFIQKRRMSTAIPPVAAAHSSPEPADISRGKRIEQNKRQNLCGRDSYANTQGERCQTDRSGERE